MSSLLLIYIMNVVFYVRIQYNNKGLFCLSVFQFFRDELQNTDGFERQSIFHGHDDKISVADLWNAWKRSNGLFICLCLV